VRSRLRRRAAGGDGRLRRDHPRRDAPGPRWSGRLSRPAPPQGRNPHSGAHRPLRHRRDGRRARALLRRGQATQSTKLSYDDLELDLAKRTARRAGHGIKLTSKEFVLLEYFVRNPDRVLSRQSIAEKVWDINYEPSSNVIDVYVSALRRKIDREFERPLIHTIIGTGYRFGIMDEPPTAEPGA
jgi:DNA-binding winged helix-turn-helix (wHTH) protein